MSTDKTLIELAKQVPKRKRKKPGKLKKAKPDGVERFIEKSIIGKADGRVEAHYIYNKYRLELNQKHYGMPVSFLAFCRKMSKHFPKSRSNNATRYHVDGSNIDQSEEAFWKARHYVKNYKNYKAYGKKSKEALRRKKEKQKKSE
jgi:hypothetical protein